VKSKLLPVFALALAAAAACSSDSTGSSGNPDASGTWSFGISNATDGSGWNCNLTGVTLTIAESGDTITGSSSGGHLLCTQGNAVVKDADFAPAAVSGNVAGITVTFNLDGPFFHNHGFIGKNEMHGDGSMTLFADVPDALETHMVLGTFEAHRQ
jgi:hypothetical protein